MRYKHLPSESNTYVFWMIAVYLVISSSIALLTDNQVLDRHGWLEKFSSCIAEMIPQIDSLSKISNYFQVTKLFLSFTWLYSICAGTILFVQNVLVPIWLGKLIPLRFHSKRQVFFVFATMPFLLWMGTAWMTKTSFHISDLSYTAGRGKALIAFASQSRLGLLIVGGVFPASVIAVYFSSATILIGIINNQLLRKRRF